MSRIVLPPKPAADDRLVRFDMTDFLRSGVTITAQSVVAQMYFGEEEDDSADIISGSATQSAGVVSQLIVDGTEGATYLLTCTITTSSGERHTRQAFLAVMPGTV